MGRLMPTATPTLPSAPDLTRLPAMLTRLKLTAIRDQLDTLLGEAARRELTLAETVAYLCEREIARKDERRIEMALGLARFSMVRDLGGYDFAAQPAVDKQQIRELAPRDASSRTGRPSSSSAHPASAKRTSPSVSGAP
jgi:DNA replication protein DnaC